MGRGGRAKGWENPKLGLQGQPRSSAWGRGAHVRELVLSFQTHLGWAGRAPRWPLAKALPEEGQDAPLEEQLGLPGARWLPG